MHIQSGGGNLGTGEFSWVFVKNIFESFIPFWRQCYAWVESYIYTCKLFYPIPRPLVHHSTETKYQSQRNPKHMSVDKNKASSTTVQPTYCPSFKNRLLWLVVICSFPTPFPVGLIPTMQGGLQAFPDDWQLSFLKKWNKTKHLLQNIKLINIYIYLAPTRFTGLFLEMGENVISTHAQIEPCPVQTQGPVFTDCGERLAGKRLLAPAVLQETSRREVGNVAS